MTSRLALGAAQLGDAYGIANKLGRVSDLEIKKMLKLAALGGLNTIDTAIAYGDSESRLGMAGLNDFQVITKLPEIPNVADISEWILLQIQNSLIRLRISSLHGVLLHRPAQLVGVRGNEVLSGLSELKYLGLVEKIGVSIYSPQDLDGIAFDQIDLVQAPYNLIDQRLFTSGLAHQLVDSGIEIHARSAFLQGLLLLTANTSIAKFDRWQTLWSRWREWLSIQSVTPVEACLGFVLAQSSISRVVVGAESSDQLFDLLSVSKSNLISKWPNLSCDDLALINPSNWNNL